MAFRDYSATWRTAAWWGPTEAVRPASWQELVGLWSMLEGGGGTVICLSGRAGDATFNGDPTWGGNYYVQLDGVGDYVGVPYIQNAAQMTITIKFRTSTDYSGGEKDLLTHQTNSGWFRFLTNNTLRMYIYDGAWQYVTSSAALNDGAWHTALLVINQGDTIEGYVDGVSIGTDTCGTIADIPSRPLNFGASHTGSNNWTGDIGYVAYYERLLSAAEIAEMHALGRAYWLERQSGLALKPPAAAAGNPWYYYQQMNTGAA